MNLPNQLTLLRLLMVPLFMICLHMESVAAKAAAFIIYIAAGVTDLVDGYLARKHNLVTPFGVVMDPLADKLMVAAAFISFVGMEGLHVPSWMVVLIVGREFLITGLRSLSASHGQLIPADDGGKLKTSVQNTTILTVLVVLTARSIWEMRGGLTAQPVGGDWRLVAIQLLEWTPYCMMYVATVFSLTTGIGYLRKQMPLLLKSV